MNENETLRLKREIRGLMSCMDFVSRHPVLAKFGKEAKRMAEVYQQLGVAWEFLALQCRHGAGLRKISGGRQACKICGTVQGAREPWLLLPREGGKTVGHHILPSSKKTFGLRRGRPGCDENHFSSGNSDDTDWRP